LHGCGNTPDAGLSGGESFFTLHWLSFLVLLSNKIGIPPALVLLLYWFYVWQRHQRSPAGRASLLFSIWFWAHSHKMAHKRLAPKQTQYKPAEHFEPNYLRAFLLAPAFTNAAVLRLESLLHDKPRCLTFAP
jgi:hypothetical protein